MFNKKTKEKEEKSAAVEEKKAPNLDHPFHKMFPLVLGAFSLILGVTYLFPSLFGVVGGFLRDLFFGVFGGAAIAMPVILFILAVTWRKDVEHHARLSKWLSGICFVLFLAALLFLIQIPEEMREAAYLPPYSYEEGGKLVGGGFFGNLIGFLLVNSINIAGVVVLFILSVLLMLVSFFNFDPKALFAALWKKTSSSVKNSREKRAEEKARLAEEKKESAREAEERKRENERILREQAALRAEEERIAREKEAARRLEERSRRVMVDLPDSDGVTERSGSAVSDTATPLKADINGSFIGRTAADYPLDNDVFYSDKTQKEKVTPLRPIRKSGGLSGVDTSNDYLNRVRDKNIESREKDLAAQNPRTLEDFASMAATASSTTGGEKIQFSRESIGGIPQSPVVRPIAMAGDTDINDIPITEEGVVYSRRNVTDIPTPDDPAETAFAAAQARAKAEAERIRLENAEREERNTAVGAAVFSAPDLSEKKPSENPAVFANPYLVKKTAEPTFTPPAPAEAPASNFTSYYRKETVGEEKRGFDFSAYKYPDVSFLTPQDYADESSLDAEVAANMERLIQTLKSFNVQAEPRSTTRGPRVTRYEIVPAIGVRINTITSLQNEISMNLCAESLRIEAPIPGDSAIGIEVPNKSSKPVRLRGLIDSDAFREAKSKTTIALGRDIAGKAVFTSIAEMPHMLVAGATGMGKSVCINTIITSILYKARPDEVRLILVDPKMVEFNIYQGIPHLLVPVVNSAKQALGALNWAAEEMDRRFAIISSVGARDLDGYAAARQQNPTLESLPRIVIVIDELNDLILSLKNSKPLDDVICRIAQKARAAGIHLILGTQRPTVNVITGNIKANISARIAFHVNQKVDSTTIIDAVGAEKLLDKGDMLYMKSSKIKRIQCCLVDGKEIEKIVGFLRANSDGDIYDMSAMAGIDRATNAASEDGKESSSATSLSQGDDGGHVTPDERKFWEAVEVTVNAQKASTSLLQRKLAVGYSRAAKFIDQMEELGIVGPQDEKKARELLMSMDEVAELRARLAGSGIFEDDGEDDE